MSRVVCHFSCGAASAIATKIAIQEYRQVEIYRCDTGSESPDNERFQEDCERWFGQSVNVIRSEEYASTDDVWSKARILVHMQHNYSPCTVELKKRPWQKHWRPGDVEVFGYTAEESRRVTKWKSANFERIIECPLIDRHLTKRDCFGILAEVGIQLPLMYRQGFRNNNCIGCVKARDSVDYWKRVRKYYPERFAALAAFERQFGFALNRVCKNGVRTRVFLDEISPGDPRGRDPDIQCGLFCGMEAKNINDNAGLTRLPGAAPGYSDSKQGED